MLFEWTDEKVEWYIRASRAAGFHRLLADWIRPALEKTDHVVDLGCGPGLIDLEISPFVKDITAIDVNSIVLNRFEREIEKSGCSNIRTMLGDVKENPNALLPDSFDVALFCFFGGPGNAFEAAYKKASRLAIFITHGIDTSKKPSKISGGLHRIFSDDVDAYLNENGMEYTKIDESIDFYQPFISIEEAERFFNVYAKEGEEGSKERRAQIERQLALVEKTDDPIYPWYFANLKDAAIYFIKK